MRLHQPMLMFLAAAACGAPALADDLERSFDVGPRGTLELESDLGAIEVSAATGDQVRVRVSRSGRDADAFIVEFAQDGTTVRVRGRYDGEAGRWGDNRLRVRYRIEVPAGFDVDLRTGGGAIGVESLSGNVRAATSGGSLDFGRIGGTVWGRTSGGSIDVTACAGKVDVATSGGSIDIGDTGGEVQAHTSGGSIRIGKVTGSVDARTSGGSIIVDESVGPVRARTSGGSVRAYISQQPAGDSELATAGGNVTVYLADGIGLTVDADGGHGGVRSDFPIGGRDEAERRLRGDLSGGGPTLTLDASGGVRIKRR